MIFKVFINIAMAFFCIFLRKFCHKKGIKSVGNFYFGILFFALSLSTELFCDQHDDFARINSGKFLVYDKLDLTIYDINFIHSIEDFSLAKVVRNEKNMIRYHKEKMEYCEQHATEIINDINSIINKPRYMKCTESTRHLMETLLTILSNGYVGGGIIQGLGICLAGQVIVKLFEYDYLTSKFAELEHYMEMWDFHCQAVACIKK
jgi:hypothetical protein